MAPSGPSLVTVDLGNSRVKLRAWRPEAARALEALPAPLASCDLPIDSELAAGVYRWFTEGLARGSGDRRVALAALCSVAAPEVEANLREQLEELTDGALEVAPEPGLVNRCRSPETVGHDRLFAARGAFELVRGPALVVDAGTCLTVDALHVEADGATGVFLGGAIAPGPGLLTRALGEGGARLPEVRIGPEGVQVIEALGKDTPAALRAGVVVGFRGAARALVAGVAREAGLEGARLVLTGGARKYLADPLAVGGGAGWTEALGSSEVLEVEELVHFGLLAALSGADR